MTLQVFLGDNQAKQVYGGAVGLAPAKRRNLGVNGYAVVNFQGATALGTDGAGPCAIIVVHKARGHGALGHYPGYTNPMKLVEGVRSMVASLGGAPVAAVVLAAGLVHDTSRQDQAGYQRLVVASVQSECGRAQVSWSEAPGDKACGCCYYLPLAEQVGLFVHPPGSFPNGGGDDEDFGITVHTY